MILAEYFHNGFLQQANYTDSQYLAEMSVAERDYYFNRAKNTLIEYWVNLAENNEFVRQQLRQITLRDVVLKGKKKDDKYVSEYPSDILKPLKTYAIAGKKTCGDRRLVIRRLQSDKIERALKNPNSNRFWDFEETIGVEQSDGFAIYTGGLTIKKVVMDYIRKVPDIAAPHLEKFETYVKFSGGNPTTSNFELDSTYLADKIIALAVLFAQRDRGQAREYQTQLQTILNVERVF
jgi:hypothetical protein